MAAADAVSAYACPFFAFPFLWL